MIGDTLEGFSRAMFSTWIFDRSLDLLWDCGESVSLNLGPRVFGVKHIFLSHGHMDHICGLPGFLFARTAGMGDRTKPLNIFYPEGDPNLKDMRVFLEACYVNDSLAYELNWIPLQPGQVVQIGKGRSIKTFQTEHQENRLTLGYQLNERRRKLKKEFVGLGSDAIADLVENGQQVSDETVHPLVVYTGDTIARWVPEFAGVDLLMHECTFILGDDVKFKAHTLIDEVLELAIQANPKVLFLYHFSVRYSDAMIAEHIKEMAEKKNIPFPIMTLVGGKIETCFSPFK